MSRAAMLSDLQGSNLTVSLIYRITGEESGSGPKFSDPWLRYSFSFEIWLMYSTSTTKCYTWAELSVSFRQQFLNLKNKGIDYSLYMSVHVGKEKLRDFTFIVRKFISWFLVLETTFPFITTSQPSGKGRKWIVSPSDWIRSPAAIEIDKFGCYRS